MDWTGLDWTARQWSGLDWTEPDHFRRLNWTALYFTGLDCRSLSLTSPDCTTLLYLALPCLTGKYNTGQSLHLATLIYTELHSTFPKETDKDQNMLALPFSDDR